MGYVCELFVDYIASLVLLKTISSGEGEFYVAFIICLPFDMSIDRFIVYYMIYVNSLVQLE